ncbi:MAG TPA: metallophosphoesterase [Sphingomicrobium sp.]|nr:metallophosphoesterase [Sphingomicrobium sp.]
MPKAPPRTPRGYRAYVVGDVHGRLDLLDRLLALIEADVEQTPARKSLLVFLGDLIDRGPDSRAVVERLRTYQHDRLKPYFLAGNHEEVLLRLLTGERGILSSWLQFGGAECLQSYGLDPASLRDVGETAALAEVKKAIPTEHARFIGGFADTLSFGDYLLVHAGLRPKVDLSLQSQSDLRWIRSPFLEDESDHGMMVVHGHTISPAVEERPNRIGIDTGAYRTGVLTALVLEGTERRILNTAKAEVGTEPAAH